VAGVIDDVGAGVTQWKKGQRVGMGWHGGQDGTCLACRRGDFANCSNLRVSGISFDGGYGEYMVAPVEAVAAMPESLEAVEAAPLLCAGITTFNALRHSGALPGDLVAVQGIDAVEKRLGDTGVGLTVWVPTGRVDGGYQQQLGYTKIDGKWRLAIQTTSMLSEPEPLAQMSRETRIAALDLMPQLIKALSDKVNEELRKAKGELEKIQKVNQQIQ
jgi:Alcohol dehydrogenase GroES-like domain